MHLFRITHKLKNTHTENMNILCIKLKFFEI